MQFTIDWLKEWGCSRSYGLGTKLPFDEQYLIESLSDSTIYMSYYTIAHLLQRGYAGEQPGALGIAPKDLTRHFWDYVLLGKPYDATQTAIPEDKLQQMRQEFLYWYPLDLRVSAKDLSKLYLFLNLYKRFLAK